MTTHLSPRQRTFPIRSVLGTAIIVGITAVSAAAQELAHRYHEFRVNTTYASDQNGPHVDTDSNGNFVVVWESGVGPPTDYDVRARRFDRFGTPLSEEFAPTTTYYSHHVPRVAREDNGDFVLTWTSWMEDGDGLGIHGRRFNATGTPLGDQFQVNTAYTGYQYLSDIAMDADGDFVIVWSDDGYVSGVPDIVGKRYSKDGTDLGEFVLPNTDARYNGHVASDAAGNFVVVWDYTSAGDKLVGAQRFDDTGVPQGTPFRVNTTASPIYQSRPEIDSDRDGNFVIVWETGDGHSVGVSAQRYDATGATLGGEFQVNNYTFGGQASPVVAMDAHGRGFVVLWESSWSGTTELRAQRFGPDGERVGVEFRPSSGANAFSFGPTAARGMPGNFVTGWTDQDDGSSHGVSGQLFGPPNQLAGDFGSLGLWHYASSWTNLTPWDASTLERWQDSLLAGFTPNRGLWRYESSGWTQIAGWTPYAVKASGEQFAAAFDAGRGIWSYDGDVWAWRTPWEPEQLTTLGENLAADFGLFRGVYTLDFETGAWTWLAGWDPQYLQSVDGKLAADFGTGRGIWLYAPASGWQQLTNWDPSILGTWGAKLVAGFDSGRGIFTYDATSGWQQLTNWEPYLLATWNARLVAAFDSGRGIYTYDPTNGWQQLTNWEPSHIEIFDNAIAAQFGPGRGVIVYREGSGWTQISGSVSQALESAAVR